MESVTQIETFLQEVLQTGADADGKSTGFIKRTREFQGSSFAQMMILGQLQRADAALSDLAHFVTYAGVKVTEQAIEKRFTSTTAIFLEQVLQADRGCDFSFLTSPVRSWI